ncbi:hypothetical protein GCM10011352_10510 [Marinobacterium zhoushanense]|uniref:Uncharacterized protein n=1 Tax=Marinobacterium zhoushanense TaxID=1679163 RepID=A0ABQ1K751_9GAMM|nr:hypothetical protein [Marinobacterium zhoushanense]GGB86509.1 hypothetical protein GCM10011352_10510 [Marinobacterium zhoushanense]
MSRRSWRDLETGEEPEQSTPSMPFATPSAVRSGSDSLAEAAALAPDSRLNQLMARRDELQSRLRELTGESERDQAARQRFPVASFAERRAEEQLWAAQRAAARQREEPSTILPTRGALPPSPLEGRMDAGMPGRSGLSQGLGDRFASASRSGRSGLGRAREALTPLQSVSRPVGDARRSVDDARDQLRDLDQRLAAEGVSETDRQEIRDTLQGDRLDKTSAVLNRAQSALDAPKRAVERVEREWQSRENQISGAMDRFSSYADRREQRLSVERGGSGDLFARMQANRQRALERRREQQQEEQRDQQRRERAQTRQRERQREQAES